MATNHSEATITDIIEPAITQLGFELVRVQLQGQQRVCLQVMVERADQTAITLDDCAHVSTVISALLDAHDPITRAYVLEVSSPGIDRPLVRLADFERFRGRMARLETSRLINGRRRFTGCLLGNDGTNVRLDVTGEEIALPFADIAKAKLVLTDDLLAAHARETNVES